jgi:hypothetical protein
MATPVQKEKVRSFPWFRTVKAHMVERYIFNYRMPPAELKKRLPVSWLEPQVINGSSAVSFCILWLEHLTVSPIPALLRFSTISCAYRIGVLDASVDPPEPSVYVTDRWADLPLISILGPLVLHDSIPVIKGAIGHEQGGETHVQMSYTDGGALFSGSARPTPDGKLQSKVFGSVDDFSAFIKAGVSSYAPSLQHGVLTKVDLIKEDVAYEPLVPKIEYSELVDETWRDSGLEVDSAVHAHGAQYIWAYRGLWSAAGRQV